MPKRKHQLDLFAFSEPLSVEARYWIGFLLADGCIADSESYPRVCLSLKFTDSEHVKRFARFVHISEESIKCDAVRKGYGARLRFIGRELIPQLAKYGVVPRKSLIASVHPDLANDRDFWRGLIDGDGCVGKNAGYNCVRLCGSLRVVESFRELCFARTGIRPALTPSPPIFCTGLTGFKATKLLEWLYYPGALALERKALAWTRA